MDRLLISALCFLFCIQIAGQGVTTGSIEGSVSDMNDEVLPGVEVTVMDGTTGFQKNIITDENGRYRVLFLKVGNKYSVTANLEGFQTFVRENVSVALGRSTTINITLSLAEVHIDDIEIVDRARLSSHELNGNLSTNISSDEIRMFPTANRSILDYLALNPLAGNTGFAGMGSRANYISVNGMGFNNVYGIGGPTAALIGNVVGAEPFGVDVIESIQINANPYDVALGSFTGASINAVTRRGSNQFSGTAYTYYSNDNFVSGSVGDVNEDISAFKNFRLGASLAGPVIRDKLFFYLNYERNEQKTPESNFLASRPGLEGDNITRVQADDLDEISQFLLDQFDYITGPYEAYDLATNNQKLFGQLDYIISNKHRLTLNVNYLDANAEDNNTNSGSFGSGNRVENLSSMSFRNSGLVRSVRSTSANIELFSTVGARSVNKLSVGYAHFPDSREALGTSFPSVDIQQDGKTYLSFGSHLFASANRIDQKVLQIKNEFSVTLKDHFFTIGAAMEKYNFEYDFTPAFYGSYVFSSLEDFYNSQPIGTLTPIGLSNGIGRPSRYARRYATDAQEETFVIPAFTQTSLYFQDKWAAENIQFTAGVRFDYRLFGGSPLRNENIETLVFQDDLENLELMTNKLPDNYLAVSPRISINLQPGGSDRINIRAGAGTFAGLPSMVRVGDQFVNNGILQGEISARNNQANQYPFNPDVDAYIPEDLSAPATYELNFTAEDYKAPQTFRANIGIDIDLGAAWIVSVDGIYGRSIYSDQVRNVNLNLSGAQTDSTGRLVYNSAPLNSPEVIAAYLLDNSSDGTQRFVSLQVKKKNVDNWFATFSYTFGSTKDYNSFGASTTKTSFRSLPVSGDVNSPSLAFADHDMQHKIMAFAGKSFEFFNSSKTEISLFLEAGRQGRFSYTYAGNGDVNDDGIPSNDLIYVPTDIDDIALESYNRMGNMITVEEQWEALNSFIENSEYLSTRRGEIAERNGSLLPWYTNLNARISQTIPFGASGPAVDIFVDVFNLPNLLNSSWGTYQIPANLRPIQAMQNGNFRVDPSALNTEFVDDTGLRSRWQLQFGARLRF